MIPLQGSRLLLGCFQQGAFPERGSAPLVTNCSRTVASSPFHQSHFLGYCVPDSFSPHPTPPRAQEVEATWGVPAISSCSGDI